MFTNSNNINEVLILNQTISNPVNNQLMVGFDSTTQFDTDSKLITFK